MNERENINIDNIIRIIQKNRRWWGIGLYTVTYNTIILNRKLYKMFNKMISNFVAGLLKVRVGLNCFFSVWIKLS